MAEEAPPPASSPPPPLPSPEAVVDVKQPWLGYNAEDVKRTFIETTSSALRSARSVRENPAAFQDLKAHYRTYEDVLLQKIKDKLIIVREHPDLAIGVAAMSGLILLRGPRRFLYRQTLGRFQSEQAMFDRAEKKVSELGQSVAVAKKEDAKLLERASFAEQDMQNGFQRLIKSGSEIRKLANSVYKIERQAEDLMAGLRQVPGREAIKLRSEVASMADTAKQQRITLQKRIFKISELGVSV